MAMGLTPMLSGVLDAKTIEFIAIAVDALVAEKNARAEELRRDHALLRRVKAEAAVMTS